MKILFAIQGTGNGHISRAITLLPYLKKYGKVDLLVSGKHNGIAPALPVSFHYDGLGFSFGKTGGIDFAKTFTEAKILRIIKELESVPVDNYDLVINDFEPITAWACKIKQRPCLGLSHQAALLLPGVPLPDESNILGNLVLKHYAPVSDGISFHFKSWHPDILTPVIRNDLRETNPRDNGHLTVYLPAYSEHSLTQIFANLSGVKVEIFASGAKKRKVNNSVTISPVEQNGFVESMASAHAVICGAGFETPAEALFLKKKLLVIPMKNQYEQQCNAAALDKMGVKVLQRLGMESTSEINNWLATHPAIHVNFPNRNQEIFEQLFEKFENQTASRRKKTTKAEYFDMLQTGYNNIKNRAINQLF